MGQVAFWKTHRRSSQDHAPQERTNLALDRSRTNELTEAWILVVTPYGPGTLVMQNSD